MYPAETNLFQGNFSFKLEGLEIEEPSTLDPSKILIEVPGAKQTCMKKLIRKGSHAEYSFSFSGEASVCDVATAKPVK
jgi:hypothetical protein